MISCGKKDGAAEVFVGKGSETTLTTPETSIAQTTPEPTSGATLIAQNDCVSCHKIDEKLIGPAYRDIAKKYSAGEAKVLAEKIIQGGSGNWGEVPMAPHPGISQQDAEKMANYILSLK